MAKEKKQEPKSILKREYIIPLRKSWLKVPEYKRTNKAIKAIKEFLVKHMKIYERDLRKIKIGMILNNEIRFRGIKKPPAKIKVMAEKFDNDIVKVKLVNIPEHIKFKKIREAKKEEKIKGKLKEKTQLKEKEEKIIEDVEDKEKIETKKDEKEKIKPSKEEKTRKAKQMAKEYKHTTSDKNTPTIKRKTLSR